MKYRSLALLLTITLNFFLGVRTVHAQDFTTDYQVTYQLQEGGVVHVSHEVTLTNLTDASYVSEYSLFLNSSKITNVTASGRQGEIHPQFEIKDEKAEIKVPLGDKVTGVNATQTIKINYDALDIAERYGQLWEVMLPKLSAGDDIRNYNVSINVPKSFGTLDVVHPKPTRVEEGIKNTAYFFNSEQMRQFGVLMGLGNIQYYTVNLTYHLLNPESKTILTQIALPPDVVNHQEVRYFGLQPQPVNVETDADGNYLATYELLKNEQKDIVLKGVIRVSPSQESRISNETIASIPATIRRDYTKDQPFWPVNNEMKKQALSATSANDGSVYSQASLLYQYVTNTLTYSPDRLKVGLERFGAKKALENPTSALCMEYTDVYVALARSLGIPAREVDGYAYTPDTTYLPTLTDVLHAWVEVYLPGRGFVSIDPTWGSTTGGVDYFNRTDANHVYFAIKGLNSEFPYPAGSYKLSANGGEDVSIHFSTLEEIKQFESIKPKFTLSLEGNSNQTSGLPIKGELIVTNKDGLLLRGGSYTVGLQRENSKTQTGELPALPPYGQIRIPFTLSTQSHWEQFSGDVEAKVSFANLENDQQVAKAVKISPLGLIISAVSLSLLGVVILLYAIFRRVKGPKQSH